MQRLNGFHVYINIANLNQIVLDEEKSTGRVNHSIHAMDTFFSSVERYGKRLSPNKLIVEKITGSRLHLYILDDIINGFDVVKRVSSFAYCLTQIINHDISKYKTLTDFKIQIGTAYGKFYDFVFIGEQEYSEETTIGYAANYAAKLQGLAPALSIAVSEDIFESLPSNEQRIFQKKSSPLLKKYGQSCYYASFLSSFATGFAISEKERSDILSRANNLNLSDIDYSGVRQTLSFDRVSTMQCKRLNGIPVFADVRGFTSQFAADDSNLEEMSDKTQEILTKLYQTTKCSGGVHVQFQGDRELALFHDVPEQAVGRAFTAKVSCFKPAVIAAMRMVDVVKPLSVHIGVGEDYGRLFATKIGARGQKDNILLGETVISADYMEDSCAGENQVAISKEVFQGLKEEDRHLADLFQHQGDFYIATVGYVQYVQSRQRDRLKVNTKQNNYNGGWGEK